MNSKMAFGNVEQAPDSLAHTAEQNPEVLRSVKPEPFGPIIELDGESQYRILDFDPSVIQAPDETPQMALNAARREISKELESLSREPTEQEIYISEEAIKYIVEQHKQAGIEIKDLERFTPYFIPVGALARSQGLQALEKYAFAYRIMDRPVIVVEDDEDPNKVDYLQRAYTVAHELTHAVARVNLRVWADEHSENALGMPEIQLSPDFYHEGLFVEALAHHEGINFVQQLLPNSSKLKAQDINPKMASFGDFIEKMIGKRLRLAPQKDPVLREVLNSDGYYVNTDSLFTNSSYRQRVLKLMAGGHISFREFSKALLTKNSHVAYPFRATFEYNAMQELMEPLTLANKDKFINYVRRIQAGDIASIQALSDIIAQAWSPEIAQKALKSEIRLEEVIKLHQELQQKNLQNIP